MPVDRSHDGSGQPASFAFSISPSDSSDLAFAPRGIYIGGAGLMRVTMLQGDDVTFTGLVAGSILPIRVKRVWSTGTTATGLLGIY